MQEADALHIETSTTKDDALQGEQASLYTGQAVVTDGRVSGYATACRTGFPYQKMVRILPTSPGENGFGFAAETLFVTNAPQSPPNRQGHLIVESCLWVMTRISAATPEMDTCAAK